MKKTLSYLRLIPALLFAIVLMNSCSKDISVNADWEDVTVIFGLLDQDLDTQFVKINKAFLGDADAYSMAQVRDSSEYSNITATVEEWKDGTLIKTFTLGEYEVTDKEEGIFYAPNQTVYYFTKNGRLDSLASYKLKVIVNPGTAKEKTVTSETEIIDDVRFGGQYLRWTDKGSAKISLDFASGTEVLDQTFNILTQPNAKRYEVYGVFEYTEVVNNGSGNVSTVKSFEYQIAEKIASNSDGGLEIPITMSGEQFFQLVGDNVLSIEDTDDNIVKRIVGDGSFKIRTVVAGDDLNTYMEVNEPSSGIVQDKKEYTNVENGIGIFSTRTSNLGSIRLSQSTIKELMYGELTSKLAQDGIGYTAGRKFCNSDIGTNFCESCYATNPCW